MNAVNNNKNVHPSIHPFAKERKREREKKRDHQLIESRTQTTKVSSAAQFVPKLAYYYYLPQPTGTFFFGSLHDSLPPSPSLSLSLSVPSVPLVSG